MQTPSTKSSPNRAPSRYNQDLLTFHESTVRVRYAETDQMGVVYHANYLIWMEVGRVEYFRAAGIRYRDMEEQDGIRLAVVEANCRYISPAHYDDEVIIRTSIEEANRRSVRLSYHMREAESDRKLAAGFTRHFFLSHDMRPAKLPQKYWALFGIS